MKYEQTKTQTTQSLWRLSDICPGLTPDLSFFRSGHPVVCSSRTNRLDPCFTMNVIDVKRRPCLFQ